MNDKLGKSYTSVCWINEIEVFEDNPWKTPDGHLFVFDYGRYTICQFDKESDQALLFYRSGPFWFGISVLRLGSFLETSTIEPKDQKWGRDTIALCVMTSSQSWASQPTPAYPVVLGRMKELLKDYDLKDDYETSLDFNHTGFHPQYLTAIGSIMERPGLFQSHWESPKQVTLPPGKLRLEAFHFFVFGIYTEEKMEVPLFFAAHAGRGGESDC